MPTTKSQATLAPIRTKERFITFGAPDIRDDEAFRDLSIATPAPSTPESRHAHHLYTVLVEDGDSGRKRDVALAGLTREGIGGGVHYVALPEHPYYRDHLGWRAEDTPHATSIGRRTISLPISPKLTAEDVSDVIKAVRRVFCA